VKPTRDMVRGFVQLAELGWRLGPVKAGSARPLRSGWQDAWTSNLARVESWAREYPAMAVRTGLGFDVFDIEDEHVARSRRAIESHRGPKGQSASGGVHLFGLPLGRGCPDIHVDDVHVGELKGGGGFVVALPSWRPKGTYRWIVPPWAVPLTPASPEMLEMVPAPRQMTALEPVTTEGEAREVLEELARKVATAEFKTRNKTLFTEALRAGRRGIPAGAIRVAMTRAARVAGLDAEEIVRTIDSAIRTATEAREKEITIDF
jgi:hypothetical protein